MWGSVGFHCVCRSTVLVRGAQIWTHYKNNRSCQCSISKLLLHAVCYLWIALMQQERPLWLIGKSLQQIMNAKGLHPVHSLYPPCLHRHLAVSGLQDRIARFLQNFWSDTKKDGLSFPHGVHIWLTSYLEDLLWIRFCKANKS